MLTLAQVELQVPEQAAAPNSEQATTDAKPLPPAEGQNAVPPIANWLPAALLAVGVMLLMTSLFRRMKNSSRTPTPAPAERIASIRAKAGGTENLERVMVDCEELAQRLAAHLDNKAAVLERLIAEADAKIARLESARSSRTLAEPAPRHREVSEDPIRARIYELADNGSSPVEIAQATDQPTGQVELILALRNA